MSTALPAGHCFAALLRKEAWKRAKNVIGLTTLLVAYLVVAYLVMPVVWSWYVWDHPTLDAIPHITSTADGLPGDPLNVALIGTETALKKMLLAAKWDQANPLTFRSSLEIAEAAVLDRPYADAPVSNLYLWGRKEDLAFEQPVGDNPRQRHHVRLWRADQVDRDGRPMWVGAAIYDTRVGFSDTTGQVTITPRRISMPSVTSCCTI